MIMLLFKDPIFLWELKKADEMNPALARKAARRIADFDDRYASPIAFLGGKVVELIVTLGTGNAAAGKAAGTATMIYGLYETKRTDQVLREYAETGKVPEKCPPHNFKDFYKAIAELEAEQEDNNKNEVVKMPELPKQNRNTIKAPVYAY